MEEVVNTKLGRKPCLPKNLRDSSFGILHSYEEKIFGIVLKSVCRFALQPAMQNGIENPFSKEKGNS